MIDYHTIQKSKLHVVIHWFTCKAMMFGLRTIGHPIFPYKERHRKVLHNIYKTNYIFFYLVFYLSFKLSICPKFSNMFQ
jgi:membrane-bound metal-dependent hydrolase YbcI (DUF457 family)